MNQAIYSRVLILSQGNCFVGRSAWMKMSHVTARESVCNYSSYLSYSVLQKSCINVLSSDIQSEEDLMELLFDAVEQTTDGDRDVCDAFLDLPDPAVS